MPSDCQVGLSHDCEEGLNRQVNLELKTSYLYLAMAQYLNSEKVALPGFAKFFENASTEEREHAIKLMKYITKRRGKLTYEDIEKPRNYKLKTGLEAIRMTLGQEIAVLKSLFDLHKTAIRKNDHHLATYLLTEFIDEQYESIERLEGILTKLKRCGSGLGEIIFDKELQSGGGYVH